LKILKIITWRHVGAHADAAVALERIGLFVMETEAGRKNPKKLRY
jgi:hypothetical protein